MCSIESIHNSDHSKSQREEYKQARSKEDNESGTSRRLLRMEWGLSSEFRRKTTRIRVKSASVRGEKSRYPLDNGASMQRHRRGKAFEGHGCGGRVVRLPSTTWQCPSGRLRGGSRAASPAMFTSHVFEDHISTIS